MIVIPPVTDEPVPAEPEAANTAEPVVVNTAEPGSNHEVVLTAMWRIAAWAPDEAREAIVAELAAASERDDDVALAQFGELLARVFAVTGQWELATLAYEQAASSWDELGDELRGATLRMVAEQFPLTPLGSDQDALLAEQQLVERVLINDPPPLVRRAVLEIRRQLAPRRLPGQLEASFGLAPEDMALLMAAVAGVFDEKLLPARTVDEWCEVLEPSTRAQFTDPELLVRWGLCIALPALTPHPGLVSRLLGRERLEAPKGSRLTPMLPDGEAAIELRDGIGGSLRLGQGVVIISDDAAGRRRVAMAVAAQLGGVAMLVQPTLGATALTLRDAAREVRLHGGLMVIEVAEWNRVGVDLGHPEAAELLRLITPILLSDAVLTKNGVDLVELYLRAEAGANPNSATEVE